MMRPIRRSYEPPPLQGGVRIGHPINARYVVVVDLDTIPQFDYEIKRAFDEIQLLSPKAADSMFVITVATAPGNIIRVTTPYSTSIDNFTEVAVYVHKELSKYKIDSRIIICSTTTLALYLKSIDIAYSNVVSCISTAHLVRTCFEINYPDYKCFSDTVIENLFAIVGRDVEFHSIRGVINKYFGPDGHTALRDPRFEVISGVRYNPWLAS